MKLQTITENNSSLSTDNMLEKSIFKLNVSPSMPQEHAGRIELQKASKNDSLLNILDAEERLMSSRLLIAAEKGDTKTVYAILHQNVVPDKCLGMNGFTPLHYAAQRGHLEISQLLIQFGADVNRQTGDDETPLHLAASSNNFNIVELLLDRRASINALNLSGETALFYGCRSKNKRIVRHLVRRGIDTSIINKYGDQAKDEVSDVTLLNELGSDVRINICKLGQEELIAMFLFLPKPSLFHALQVCNQWNRASDDPKIWKQLGIKSRWEMRLSATLGIGTISTMASFRCSTKRKTPQNRRPSSSSGVAMYRSKLHASQSSRPSSATST